MAQPPLITTVPTRRVDRMSQPNPSGRIRWAMLSVALVAAAALPVAPATAADAKARVIVQVDAGSSVSVAKDRVRDAGVCRPRGAHDETGDGRNDQPGHDARDDAENVSAHALLPHLTFA